MHILIHLNTYLINLNTFEDEKHVNATEHH